MGIASKNQNILSVSIIEENNITQSNTEQHIIYEYQEKEKAYKEAERKSKSRHR